MSSQTASAQSNMKQVMRTALIGVSPADQLMLKGYLRVLLRLEADLEWVPANHPNVDLLMINNEFRNSAAVKKLMTTNSNIPAIFVNRDGNSKQGKLEEDLLTIPLTHLNDLKYWLTENVNVLGDTLNQRYRTRNEVSANEENTTDNIDNSKSLTNHKANSDVTAGSESLNSNSLNSNSNKTISNANVDKDTFASVIEFMQLVSKRPDGIFELTVDDNRVGLANLKRQRIWLSENVNAYKNDWKLVKTQEREPSGESVDLFQWLWTKAWQAPEDLLALVSDNQHFHLRYWPKPDDSSNRSDLLRVFTALEGEPRNVGAVANLAETSVNTVKKVVAGLLLSGALRPEIYETLTSPLTINSSNNTGNNVKEFKLELEGEGASSKSGKMDALDEILARRASGEDIRSASATANTHTSTKTNTQAKSASGTNKANKRGFLSKLRSKLGL